MSGRSRRKRYATKDTHISEFRNCMWSTILITFTHPEVHINKNSPVPRFVAKPKLPQPTTLRYHSHTSAYAYNIKCHTYACTVVHVSAKHVDWYKLMNDFLLYAYVGVCE